MSNQVTVIDYGMGNIWSVTNALRYLQVDPVVSGDPEFVAKSSALVLPGVGSFRKAMMALREKGLDEAILNAVKQRGSRLLGICLGMQLLGSHGTEDGDTPGLGLIPNRVDKFPAGEVGKVPHIGFNSVHLSSSSGIFKGLSSTSDFYFVHSYRMLPEGLNGQIATCNYGTDFLAAFQQDNVCGTQFHPEKSQTNGLIMLKNFLESWEKC